MFVWNSHHVHTFTHTYPVFGRLKILNIFNIYKHQVSCLIFLHMQKLLPTRLSSLFVFNSDCHQYFTRQNHNLHLYSHNTLSYFVYKALKFGITSLFPYVIRLLSRIIGKNVDITSNQFLSIIVNSYVFLNSLAHGLA